MKIVVPVDDSVNRRDDFVNSKFGSKHNLVNSDEGLGRVTSIHGRAIVKFGQFSKFHKF